MFQSSASEEDSLPAEPMADKEGSKGRQAEFMAHLMEAIADSSTKQLWRERANPVSMSFKNPNLEFKVREHGNVYTLVLIYYRA